MKTLRLKKSFYYSAGTKWGWHHNGHDVRGVGIDRALLIAEKTLRVIIEKKAYTLDCVEAINFVRQYRSHFKKDGAIIGVVSKSLLTSSIDQPVRSRAMTEERVREICREVIQEQQRSGSLF